MKMGVGLMLISFGTFWSGEGIGVHWPGHDLAIPVLVGGYAAATFVLVRTLRARVQHLPADEEVGPAHAA
jgi:Ca2+/H+ antiporter, TMEM165/GDT1 family